jgi:phosphoribosylaminoimidazolecarboxamide formyltransferase/IMP cyclohydrolase
VSPALLRPRRALLSVSDKTGLVTLARALSARGVRLVSTGGTAAALRTAGLEVLDVSAVTEHPEIMGGRVKTLHPRIHGGLLARIPGDERDLAAHGIEPFDLLVVNLYPFERAAAQGLELPALVEEIDVGGPAMLRAAAKSYARLAVLSDPDQYGPFLEELAAQDGVSEATLARLGVAAFARTAAYDAAIQAELGRRLHAGEALPARFVVGASRVGAPLRYGENPHQRAAFYRPLGPALGTGGLGALRQLHGPELSYNNLLDLAAALGLLIEFTEPVAVVVKHTNPCGAAAGSDLVTAFERARASDPVSIYGGVVGVNRPVDRRLVAALAGILLEILFAPAFEPDALEELRRTKKKLRVLEVPVGRPPAGAPSLELRSVPGGLLVQEADLVGLDPVAVRVVSRRQPTAGEWRALRFAWKVAKHVKSNAIVLTSEDQVLGVGAGQMSRVDAARLAVMRAREHGHKLAGAAIASDAFFPFRDGLDVVAEAGAVAVIHPGGSIRDEEIVAAADEHGMAMVTTGIRHFKH